MPELIALMGIPGSGKSTVVGKLKTALFAEGSEVTVVCPDTIREALTGDMSNQDRNAEVFAVAEALAVLALRDTGVVIWDATNVTARARDTVLKIAKRTNAKTRLVILDVPYEVAHERNHNRERKVPGDVLVRMHAQFHDSLSQIGHEPWNIIERIS